jgi:hypothetical protein
MSFHPDGMFARTLLIMAAYPNPMVVRSGPISFNPNVPLVRGYGYYLVPQRWRFGCHHDFAGWRCRDLFMHDDVMRAAASEYSQDAGGC